MKVAVSNIAWSPAEDISMYEFLSERRLALEIAPTRIIPWEDSDTLGRMAGPYDRIRDVANWAKNLYAKYGLHVVSMQSILNGVKANMFGKTDEKRFLINYLKSAIDFAAAVKCRNLVFGCPLNRRIPDNCPLEKAGKVAVDFSVKSPCTRHSRELVLQLRQIRRFIIQTLSTIQRRLLIWHDASEEKSGKMLQRLPGQSGHGNHSDER